LAQSCSVPNFWPLLDPILNGGCPLLVSYAPNVEGLLSVLPFTCAQTANQSKIENFWVAAGLFSRSFLFFDPLNGSYNRLPSFAQKYYLGYFCGASCW
jgi:hypothetical protein